MLFHSRFPEPWHWDAMEYEHKHQKRCTWDAVPFRLFCGKEAVSGTQEGRPRCQEHQEKERLPAAAP